MKCPHCKEDVLPGQFRCHKCGKILTEDKKKKSADKESVGKEK